MIVSAPQLRRTPIDCVRWDSPGAGRQIERSDAHRLGQKALTLEASHRSLAPADDSLRLEQDNHTHVPPHRQRRPESSCALSDSWCEWRGRNRVTAWDDGESSTRLPWTIGNRACRARGALVADCGLHECAHETWRAGRTSPVANPEVAAHGDTPGAPLGIARKAGAWR